MPIIGLLFYLAVEIFIFLPLYIIGLPVAWLAQRFAKTRTEPSRLYPDRTIVVYDNHLLNEWLGNHEDGIKPVFVWWPKEKTAFQWFVRNPVCNMRFWPIVSTKPCPSKVRYLGIGEDIHAGTPGWFLCWQGPYAGFLYYATKWGIWIGFKIRPEDRNGLPPENYRNWGIGTVAQFYLVK